MVPFGASPMPDAVLARATEKLPGCRFLHVYGMTEAAPLVTALEPRDALVPGRSRSCGKAALMVEVRIADAEDNEVPRGTVGEVQVRGPNVMLGYWNKPEQTAAALRGGWYHSGDGGYMDADGYVYVVDRLKDMIISGGENIYSAEVESAISLLDGVAEVAVVGDPRRAMGRGGACHRRAARRPDADGGAGDRALPRADRALQMPAQRGYPRHAAAAVGRRQGAEDRVARAVLGGAGEAGELTGRTACTLSAQAMHLSGNADDGTAQHFRREVSEIPGQAVIARCEAPKQSSAWRAEVSLASGRRLLRRFAPGDDRIRWVFLSR